MTRPANLLFEVPSSTQKSFGLWVEGYGSFPTKPAAWAVRGRRLAAYRVVWIERGSGWLETPLTRTTPVNGPCLLHLFPGLVHSYAADSWWSEQWIEFGGPIAESFEAAGFLDRKHPVLPLGQDAQIATQFGRIQSALREANPLAGALAAARMHELLVLAHGLRTGLRGATEARAADAPATADAPAAAEAERGEAAPHASADPMVRRAIAWIEERVDGDLDRASTEDGARVELRPEDVASALDVGYSTLRRRFKLVTGFSIKEYILSLQLRRAKQLLIYSVASVEDIAERVGFSDPFYFSRLFRSREGSSPSEFRDRRERGPAAVALVLRGRGRGEPGHRDQGDA